MSISEADLDQEDLEIIQALNSTPPYLDWNGREYIYGRLLHDMILDDGMDQPSSVGATPAP
jgi:hypothetical protein